MAPSLQLGKVWLFLLSRSQWGWLRLLLRLQHTWFSPVINHTSSPSATVLILRGFPPILFFNKISVCISITESVYLGIWTLKTGSNVKNCEGYAIFSLPANKPSSLPKFDGCWQKTEEDYDRHRGQFITQSNNNSQINICVYSPSSVTIGLHNAGWCSAFIVMCITGKETKV